jgi:hypothetical protein
MTECEEVAVSMNPLRRLTFDEALRLPVIDGVASAFGRERRSNALSMS